MESQIVTAHILLSLIGGVLSLAATGMAVILWHMYQEIKNLAVHMAVVADKVNSHESRLTKLENERNRK